MPIARKSGNLSLLEPSGALLGLFNLYLLVSVCVSVCGGGGIYRVSQEERTKFREGVPYVKIYRYNPKHLYPKLNGYGDNGKRSLKL